jgi:hypothetical protein
MRDYLAAHIEHTLAVILLFARLADVLSTRLATPNLVLESNPIVRRLGWRFAWATLAVAALPYYSTALGVVAIVVSLLVAAGNASRAWTMRAMGEADYRAFMIEAARRSRPALAYGSVLASAGLMAVIGLLILFLDPDPRHWAHWIADGVLLYAFAIALYGTASIRRLRAAAGAGPG